MVSKKKHHSPHVHSRFLNLMHTFLEMPWDVLWCSFVFSPSPVWGQVNRQFHNYFAHKWVRTTLSSVFTSQCLHQQVSRWKGRIERLDVTSASDEGLCALRHLAGACPQLWSFSLSTRSSIQWRHTNALNCVLCGANGLTHFALAMTFPGSVPLLHNKDDGLFGLLSVGVQHIANNLREFSLTLRGCELYDNACCRIVDILPSKHMPCVHRLILDVAYNNIDVHGAWAFARWVALFPALCDVEINMAHNRGMPGDLARTFATAMAPLKLRTLSLRLGSAKTPIGYHLPPFSFQYATLERVHMDLGFVDARDVVALFLAIPTSVRCLSVRTNPHRLIRHTQRPNAVAATMLPASVLESVVTRYTQLQRLSLDFTGRCGTDTLRPLANDPTLHLRLNSLHSLRLHIGGSRGHAFADVCSLLSRMGPQVTDWDIGMTDDCMTDRAAATLAMHLSHRGGSMRHLDLDVSHNRIGPTGWTRLIEAIRMMGSLRTLHFRCNHNPIGYAAPAAIFDPVRVLQIHMRNCNLRCIDHWIAPTVRFNLVADVSKEWTLVLSDNNVHSDQCNSMRAEGWTVIC
jgi:hypothetical protein